MKPHSFLSRPLPRNKGSALLASIILVVVIAGLVGIYLDTTTKELRHSQHTYFMQSAMNYAEAGVEEILRAYNNNEFSSANHTITLDESNFSNSLGEDILVRAWAQETGGTTPDLLIRAEGRVSKGGISATKQIEIDMGRKGLFANGLTSKDTMKLKGNTITFASYNSNNGAPSGDYDTNGAEGTLATASFEEDALDQGNGDVYGYVATGGGDVEIGPNGTVKGPDTPNDVKVDQSRISNDFYAEFDDVPLIDGWASGITSLPSPDSSGLITIGTTATDEANREIYYLDELDLQSDTINVEGHVAIVVENDIDIKSTITLIGDNSSIEIYLRGETAVIGGSSSAIVNPDPNGDSTRVMVFGTPRDDVTSQNITLHGNGGFIGGVYAPYASLEMKGSGNAGKFWGAAIAKDIVLNGNFEFYYDQALDDYSKDSKMRLRSWRELVAAADRYNFDSLMSTN